MKKHATPPSFRYVVNHIHPQASVSISWGDWYYFNPPIKEHGIGGMKKPVLRQDQTHRIYGTGIFTYICLIFLANCR